MLWLAAGGLAYTLGIVFFALDRIRYFHAAWHIFVLAGSIAHYFAILFYVVPRGHESLSKNSMWNGRGVRAAR